MLPYARQTIDQADRDAVLKVLDSDWLTTGPAVDAFEKALARSMGAAHVVVVSNGTAALHAAVHAAGIGPGDEVIVTAMTFVASANAVVFCGGRPVFVDVDPASLLIDPGQLERHLTAKTKAVIAVDFGGQPCDYDALTRFTRRHGLTLISDACHALGATWKGAKVGTIADLSTFSFHPAKHLTTAEGGAIATADPELARKMRRFRSHGIDTDLRTREEKGTFAYQMVDLGYNYRLSDFQCALGLSQLAHLDAWVEKRRALARMYDEGLKDVDCVVTLRQIDGGASSYHLYVVQLALEKLSVDRAQFYKAMRAEGIGANVHYMPVHLHPFYQERFGTKAGDCPAAEAAYERILTLPMYPAMSEADVADVIAALRKVGEHYRAGGAR
jgi:perosamine synthetase